MVSRLKGIETYAIYRKPLYQAALYMVSRLKGIETLGVWKACDWHQFFVYGFPFEGN